MASSKDPNFGSQKRHTIGYALSTKKQKTIMRPSLLSLASSRGLDLIPIDPSLPISQDFHLILHKLYDDLWISNLDDFASKNPTVPIIDRSEFVKRVHDRISMLRFVSELRIPSNREFSSDLQAQHQHPCTFGVPKQTTITEASELTDPATLFGLSFPLIAKPMAADGSSGSHKMALIFDRDGLLKQSPPLVLQEFVNHGGVVFKVYVVADYVKCVRRKSLPDLSNEAITAFGHVGSMPFSQISNVTAAQDGADKMGVEEVEMPPEGFVMEIARGLRSAMGLNLFNFDMIKDGRVGNHYLVIDINYFPGYEKLPGYETVLTDFLCNMVHKEQEHGPGSALGDHSSYEKEMEKEG